MNIYDCYFRSESLNMEGETYYCHANSKGDKYLKYGMSMSTACPCCPYCSKFIHKKDCNALVNIEKEQL